MRLVMKPSVSSDVTRLVVSLCVNAMEVSSSKMEFIVSVRNHILTVQFIGRNIQESAYIQNNVSGFYGLIFPNHTASNVSVDEPFHTRCIAITEQDVSHDDIRITWYKQQDGEMVEVVTDVTDQ